MSNKKKEIRNNFRTKVFSRDKNKCVLCQKPAVDAHHITDRNEMPNGGYVLENGISLCESCHLLAEEYHISNGEKYTYHPDDLYKLIGSSKQKAIKASESLRS